MIGSIMGPIVGLTSAGGGGRLVQRNFTTFTPALSQHIEFDPVTLSGDFRIFVKFTKAGGGIVVLAGEGMGADNFIGWINSETDLRFHIDGTTTTFITPDLTEGDLHDLRATRVSGELSVTLDGVSLGTQTNAGPFVLDTIGSNSDPAASFWDGVIADFKVEDVATVVNDLRIDEDWVASLVANDLANATNGLAKGIGPADAELFTRVSGDWLGVELVTQDVWENPHSVGSEWAFANNQYTLTGMGLFNALQFFLLAEQADFFRLSVNVTNLIGELSVAASGGQKVTINGKHSFDMDTSVVGAQQFKRVTGNVNATLDKPSIKRLIKVAT